MRVMVAGVSSEHQLVKGVTSFQAIIQRPGDKRAIHDGSLGEVARNMLCNKFMEDESFTGEDAILMVDLDMQHQEDMLERLRSHNLDMVTGHYYRRQLSTMMSVVSTKSDGTWPLIPLTDIPREGLHEIASTGMGNVLIKKKVIAAVALGLPPLAHPFSRRPLPEHSGHYMSLGQDKAFFLMARDKGYKLWLDASIHSKHAVTLWLDHEVYDILSPRDADKQARFFNSLFTIQVEMHGMNPKSVNLRIKTLELQHKKLEKTFEDMPATEATAVDRQRISFDLHRLDWQMQENKNWLEAMEQEGMFGHIKVTPDGDAVPMAPITGGSDEQLRKDIENRHFGESGETEEEIIESRQGAIRGFSEKALKNMDGQNPDYDQD